MEKQTLPALIRSSLEPHRDAAVLERVDGVWKPTSSTQLLARAANVACAIRSAGLSNGERVALIAADCVDWIVADFGILFAGCVVVPIFPTQAVDQVAYILRNSEAKIVFVDSRKAAARIAGAVPANVRLVVFDPGGADDLAAFEAAGASARAQHDDWPEAFQTELDPDDMAVLIYTSGTTGEPKGVMLSHHNLGFTARSALSVAFNALTPGTDVLSVLPFSHIYEHCILYVYLLARVRHHVCGHVDRLLSDMQSVRPALMTAVPRIFERLLAGIIGRVRSEGGLAAHLVPWALRVGREVASAKTRGEPHSPFARLEYAIANELVLKKMRMRLGLDRVKYLVSGSAPLHFDVAMTMLGLGVPIIEGYGPTECSPVVSVNTFEDNHYGTVGRAIPGVEIATAPDGEILVRGANVMLGYYQNPAATAYALREGWYHTGDIGEIDAGGFLHVTDRKNELFKTSGGKFVAPARVEAAIKRSVYVNQVMVVGEGRAHPAALVSPNWELVRAQLGFDASMPQTQLANRSDVVQLLAREVRSNTADLATFEQVRKVAVLPRELTIEDGDLSPTLKVRRRVVEARYEKEIAALYSLP